MFTQASYIGNEQLALLPGETKRFDVDISVGFSITGVAKDPDGNVLPSTLVHAYGPNGNSAVSMSDAEGKFKLEHLSVGRYRLSGRRYASDIDGEWTSYLLPTLKNGFARHLQLMYASLLWLTQLQ